MERDSQNSGYVVAAFRTDRGMLISLYECKKGAKQKQTCQAVVANFPSAEAVARVIKEVGQEFCNDVFGIDDIYEKRDEVIKRLSFERCGRSRVAKKPAAAEETQNETSVDIMRKPAAAEEVANDLESDLDGYEIDVDVTEKNSQAHVDTNVTRKSVMKRPAKAAAPQDDHPESLPATKRSRDESPCPEKAASSAWEVARSDSAERDDDDVDVDWPFNDEQPPLSTMEMIDVFGGRSSHSSGLAGSATIPPETLTRSVRPIAYICIDSV